RQFRLLAGERDLALTLPVDRTVRGRRALASTLPFRALELPGAAHQRPPVLERLRGAVLHGCDTMGAVLRRIAVLERVSIVAGVAELVCLGLADHGRDSARLLHPVDDESLVLLWSTLGLIQRHGVPGCDLDLMRHFRFGALDRAGNLNLCLNSGGA